MLKYEVASTSKNSFDPNQNSFREIFSPWIVFEFRNCFIKTSYQLCFLLCCND